MADSLDCLACDYYLIKDEKVVFNAMGRSHSGSSDTITQYLENRNDHLLATFHLIDRINSRYAPVAQKNNLEEIFHEHFNKRWNSIYKICEKLTEDEGSFYALHLLYEKGLPECDCNEFINNLTPHLNRVSRIHLKLPDVERKQKRQSKVLDYLSIGIIVLDNHGDVELLNMVANQIIKQFGGLSLINNRIYPHESGERQRLEHLIAQAVSGYSYRNNWHGAMSLSSPSRTTPLNALVMSIPWNNGNPEESGATVFITDPLHSNLPNKDELLRIWLGLTRAESRLAAILTEGINLRVYAKQNGISYETARFTLKNILKKTGTSRQAELVSLILANLPQINLLESQSLITAAM